jgi:hypothetical protein
MPPRYAYWTIIAGGLPTAFRAADREELLPTFTRIKQKHPDAEMKWFARGRLWDSPDSARREAETRRRAEAVSSGSSRDRRPRAEMRGREWRPGGEHRDPRQKFKDAKKTRNADQRKRKFERRQRADRPAPQGWRPSERAPSARKPDWRRPPRRFEQKSFTRNQEREEPATPPRRDGPGREPRREHSPEPPPRPRPTEPVIQPPGPPERGHANRRHRREKKP